MDLEQIEVRLAHTGDELAQAQRLRYEVFYEECGAQPDQAMCGSRLDADPYDAIMDHLLVIDHARSLSQGQVVGNYRLLPQERLGERDVFYSSAEFDLAPLLGSGLRLLELGRSCVMRDYRGLPVLQMLWRGGVGKARPPRHTCAPWRCQNAGSSQRCCPVNQAMDGAANVRWNHSCAATCAREHGSAMAEPVMMSLIAWMSAS